MKRMNWLWIGCVVWGTLLVLGPAGAEEPPAEGASEGSTPALCEEAPPPPPPGHHPGRGGKRPEKLSAQQEEQLLDFLRENMKDHYEHLMTLRERNPHAYQRSVQFFWPRVRSLLAMPEAVRDAHIRETNLRIEIFRTARAYRQSETEQDRQASREKLQTLLAEKFEVEQKVQQYRLEQLAEQLQRLQAELQRRVQQRDEVIAEELQYWLEFSGKPFGPGPGRNGKYRPRSAPTTQPAEAPEKALTPEPAAPEKPETP